MGVNRRSFFGLFGAAAAAAPSVIHKSEARPEPERVVLPPGAVVCSTAEVPILYCSTSDE